jgi:hypothetical protein
VTRFGIDQLSLSTQDKTTLRQFVAAWDQHAQPVLFVGAGLSKFEAVPRPGAPPTSRFGGWLDLLNDMRDRLSHGVTSVKDNLPTDPLRLAQLYQARFERTALVDFIAHHVPAADFQPGEAHWRLREIPWAAVVTTNYDDLLERTFATTRSVRRVVTDEDLVQRRPSNELVIVKLHGDLAHPNTIVLAEDDYQQFETRRPGLSVKVRQLLMEHPLLFLGFSLSDPNYGRIDGWIRDMLGKMRLPAVAIVHSEPLPGEQEMWKARGIELVRLPRDEKMWRLLEALAAEQPRRRTLDESSAYHERVHTLEAKAHELARSSDADRPQLLAGCLWEIIDGARSDRDGGAEARRVAVHFCWGWHAILTLDAPRRRGGTTEPLPPSVTAKQVYEHLRLEQRRALLMCALEGGMEAIRFDPEAPVDIARELLAESLTPDEHAAVHLWRGRILRDVDATAEAALALQAARRLNPRKELQALIDLEVREVAFQRGDKDAIDAELQRPHDPADVHAMCRRGSDSLLLGKRDVAERWYAIARTAASTGDERAAALLGQLAATHETLTTDATARVSEAELRRDLRAISDAEQPASTRARDRVEQAGRSLLDGPDRHIAIEALRRYLDELRRLGWPHSPDDHTFHPMESAARQCARLLLDEDREDPGGEVQRIKEALVLLNRYGLAATTRKLFTTRHCEALARRPEDVTWFRAFAAGQPTIPRCADARLTTALAGVPLLEDDWIDATVASAISRIDALRASPARGFGSQLEDLWRAVLSACPHLPARTAVRVLEAYARYLPDPRVTRWLRATLEIGLWLEQGFIERGGPEARTIADAGQAAITSARASRDPFRLRECAGDLSKLAGAGLFGDAERGTLRDATLSALDAELANPAIDVDSALPLAALLANLDPAGQIDAPAFAARAHDFVVENLHSSGLGFALACARAALGAMQPPDREALLVTLHGASERNLAKAERGYEDWIESVEPVANTLAALVAHLPAARPEIATLLLRLAEQRSGALAALGRIAIHPTGDEAAHSARLAELALISASTARRDRVLWNIAEWLQTPAASATAEPILEGSLGLCLSDAPETRNAAIYAVSRFFRAHPTEMPAIRARAIRTLSALAGRDPAWRVRVRALDSIAFLCITPAERAEVDRTIAAMDVSLVAVERHVRTAVRRRLAPLQSQ